MSEDITFLMALGIVLTSVVLWEGARRLPRAWKWFKYSVWFDNRYAAGYRKGLTVGRATARRTDSE